MGRCPKLPPRAGGLHWGNPRNESAPACGPDGCSEHPWLQPLRQVGVSAGRLQGGDGSAGTDTAAQAGVPSKQ